MPFTEITIRHKHPFEVTQRMPNRIGQACWKCIRFAFVAACFFSALSGTLTQVVAGELAASKASGESSETEIEELRHDAPAIRRSHKLALRIVWSPPPFLLSKHGEVYRSESLRRCDIVSLAGGEHALRNGCGIPLLA